MSAYELCLARRSIRKFRQEPIPRELLLRLVDAARVAPSGRNIQPLKYKIVDDPAETAALFPLLAWAGYIQPAGDPQPGEEPMAYILLYQDTAIRNDNVHADAGAAAQSILLCAQEAGVASCWLGSVHREKARELFHTPGHLNLLYVLALGYPAEVSVAEPARDGDIKYYKDAGGRLHVPKRPLDEVLL